MAYCAPPACGTKYSPEKENQRKFKVPILNFKATDFESIIDWEKTEVSIPPILRDLTLQELEDFEKNGTKLESEIRLIPSHTQAVERCVQLVTSASSSTCSPESRTRKILNTLYSREKMESFSSKKYFNV